MQAYRAKRPMATWGVLPFGEQGPGLKEDESNEMFFLPIANYIK